MKNAKQSRTKKEKPKNSGKGSLNKALKNATQKLSKKETPHEEARIGVFICDCGVNIGGFLDVPSVAEYARTLPNVVFVQENMYTCSDAGITEIKNAIKAQKLNRVIVASCTPRTHAPLFMAACEAAGINRYLFEFVNIRDQCSWVHMKERDAATQKAKDLVRMGVVKASQLEPREDIYASVTVRSLVIGGGIAGLSAAISLAEQGFEVHLVEKEKALGGMLKFVHKLYPNDVEAKVTLGSLISHLKKLDKVKVHLNSVVSFVSGYLGNFEVTISSSEGNGKPELVKVGTIIVATGSEELKPTGLYGYGTSPKIMTQLELEAKLMDGSLKDIKNVVMIQCVGSRGQRVTYCSKTCCMIGVKNARILKNMFPNANVYVLHRGMQTYGSRYEAYYQKVREEGVHFLKYEPEEPPTVIQDQEKLVVKYFNRTMNKEFEVEPDLIVLSTPQIQHSDAKVTAQLLKVPLGQEGFFFEAHSKLRPVDFATDGVFLAGGARGPATVSESVQQALGAASKASIPLAKGKVKAEALTSWVDPEKCSGCRTCEIVCPYKAIKMIDDEGMLKADINPLLCKGCGTCVPICPSRAIKQWGFTDQQIVSQVLEASNSTMNEGEPTIIGFCCNWCSYAGADMAGVSRFQYPPNVRIIRTMCSGRVDPMWIIRAFLEGADGVLVSGCHPGDCHYIQGNVFTAERMKQLSEMLEKYGVDPKRLRLEWVSASEGNKFADTVSEFTKEIKGLGPSQLKKFNVRRRASVKET